MEDEHELYVTSFLLFQSSLFNTIILIDSGKQKEEMSFGKVYIRTQWNQKEHRIKNNGHD